MTAFIRANHFNIDLFFILSTYLITEILLREKRARNGVNVKAFWVRRILRIWPLYFVFVGAVLWLGPHIVPGESVTPAYQIGFVTFTANWVVALGGWQPSVLMPLWSISIEEQFYLTWPLVVRRLSPQPPRSFTEFL